MAHAQAHIGGWLEVGSQLPHQQRPRLCQQMPKSHELNLCKYAMDIHCPYSIYK